MARATLSASGIVMGRSNTAGGYERIELLTDGEGLLQLMRRPGSSGKNGPSPDLFDLCAVQLEARAGGAWFIKEYIVTRRFGGLGERYGALVAASAWSRLVLANAAAVESTALLYNVSLRALDAWEKGAEPSAVRMKALYLFARDEGLPAREEWFANLTASRRSLAAEILKTPLETLDADKVDAAEVAALADSLEKWMCGENYIVPPRTVK
jgi:hypothetical protein